MKPLGRTWGNKCSVFARETQYHSIASPSMRSHSPTNRAGYSVSGTGVPSDEHEESTDANSNPSKARRIVAQDEAHQRAANIARPLELVVQSLDAGEA